MATVYIIYSNSSDSFYTGFTTEPVMTRLERHNNSYYDEKYAKHGIPWLMFLEIVCSSSEQARKIESHIKKMKSKTYILNLKKYPEMIEKFNDC